MEQTMTTGEFISFTLYLGLMIAPIVQMSNIGSQLTEAMAGLDRTQELLNMSEEDDPEVRVNSLASVVGDIEFKDVSFGYEKSKEVLNELNIEFSKRTWEWCIKGNIPFLYASSAATYGSGIQGFNDEDSIDKLEPLNLYGQSKHAFDIWVQNQSTTPPFWAGFKFFNVFGPNEYHKGRMASVIMHAFNQIRSTGKMKLFQSHRSEYLNGEQKRDFIYVKDLIDVLLFFMEGRTNSGLYNLGTGKARTFKDLALSVFKAMKINPDIEYIPIPEDIRQAYQYFTEASMTKLKDAGYEGSFTPLEEATEDYINYYLKEKTYI